MTKNIEMDNSNLEKKKQNKNIGTNQKTRKKQIKLIANWMNLGCDNIKNGYSNGPNTTGSDCCKKVISNATIYIQFSWFVFVKSDAQRKQNTNYSIFNIYSLINKLTNLLK